MKLSGIALIAGLAAGAIAAAPVAAQDHVSEHRVEVHRTVTTTDHGVHHGKRKVCHTRWVHHHKVRKCTWRRW